MKFKPYFCHGCGVTVTREPWPHLDRSLLTPEAAARLDRRAQHRPEDLGPAPKRAIPEVITMSEICGVCGRPDAFYESYGDTCRTSIEGYTAEEEAVCYRLGYQRTLARADRYQAEFAACKAMLIAEQKRAERAEAERAEAEQEKAGLVRECDILDKANDQVEADLAAAEQRASEARALALRWRAAVIDFREGACEQGFKCGPYLKPGQHANWLGTFGAENCPMCMGDALAALPVEPARRQGTENANALEAAARGYPEEVRRALRFYRAELARCSDQPAPKNEPPSPTGGT